MRHTAYLLGLALCLLPLTRAAGQDATLRDVFTAAKTQWAMQGDREGATARFEAVLATLEPKAGSLDDDWRQVLCETYNWLAVLEDRVPSRRPQAAKRLEAILEVDPGFELDRSLTNNRLNTTYENARNVRFARLSLVLAPGDGELYVDGRTRRRRSSLFLPPGSHTLRYVRPGFTPQEQKLDLAARSTRALEISLVRSSSTVRLNTHPVGAEVLLDGKPVGITRGQAPASMASYAEKLGLRPEQLSGDLILEGLTPGRHRIEVKSPCHKSRTLELDPSFATPFADHTLEPVKLASARGTLSLDSPAPGGVATLAGQLLGPLPVKESPVCPGLHELRVDFSGGRYSTRIDIMEGKSLSLTVQPRPRLAFLGFEGTVPDRVRLQGMIDQLGTRLSQVEYLPSLPGESAKAALERIRKEKSAELVLLARSTPGQPQLELHLANLEGNSESTLIKPLEQDPLEALVERLNRVPSLRTPWAGLVLLDLPEQPGPWPLHIEPEAGRAGLQPQVAITHLNGQPVDTVAAFRRALASAQGDRVTLTQAGREVQVPFSVRATELPTQSPQLCYPLIMATLRLRELGSRGDEVGFNRLNMALAHMHFRQFAKALELLRDARVGAVGGVSQGTIDYYRGLCLAGLGPGYNPEARQALSQAARSPAATLFGPEGPSVPQAATQAIESLTP